MIFKLDVIFLKFKCFSIFNVSVVLIVFIFIRCIVYLFVFNKKWVEYVDERKCKSLFLDIFIS